LSNIKSRDYLSAFDLGDQEARLWKAAHQAGTFGDYANSFLILMGQNQESIKALVKNDSTSFEDPKLHRQYQPDSLSSIKSNLETTKQPDISQHELNVARDHVKHLQNQLALLEGSRSWRLLTHLRSALKAVTNVFGAGQR